MQVGMMPKNERNTHVDPIPALNGDSAMIYSNGRENSGAEMVKPPSTTYDSLPHLSFPSDDRVEIRPTFDEPTISYFVASRKKEKNIHTNESDLGNTNSNHREVTTRKITADTWSGKFIDTNTDRPSKIPDGIAQAALVQVDEPTKERNEVNRKDKKQSTHHVDPAMLMNAAGTSGHHSTGYHLEKRTLSSKEASNAEVDTTGHSHNHHLRLSPGSRTLKKNDFDSEEGQPSDFAPPQADMGAALNRTPVPTSLKQDAGIIVSRKIIHSEKFKSSSLLTQAPADEMKKSKKKIISPPTAAAATNASTPPIERPLVHLTVHLKSFYCRINTNFCKQKRQESSEYNNGYDDKDGHYIMIPSEEILERYTVQRILGKGSFGTVLRCYDKKRKETVALKIIRRGLSFRNQAKLEIDVLLKLNENPQLNHLVVKLRKVFDWQGHLVLVFELLSYSLYQLISCTQFNGIPLDIVRKFAYQLVQTLHQLSQQKPSPIVHCDLKPENILLRNPNLSGIRLIDFGSACYENRSIYKYIQSRFYRSPEVILYLPYSTAIDRWSLACVLVELHCGVPLFDGQSELAQLGQFEAVLGPIPQDMISASPKAHKFYQINASSEFVLRDASFSARSLESIIGVTTGGPKGRRLDTPQHDENSYRQFYDFISRFLKYRAEERMSCQEALQHPFLTSLYPVETERNKQKKQCSPSETNTININTNTSNLDEGRNPFHNCCHTISEARNEKTEKGELKASNKRDETIVR